MNLPSANAHRLATSGAVQRRRGPRATQRALAVAMALILAGFVVLAACLAASARPSHAGTAVLDTPTAPAAPTRAALVSPLNPPAPAQVATVAPRATAPSPTPAAWLYVPALARDYAAPITSNCPGVNLCN